MTMSLTTMCLLDLTKVAFEIYSYLVATEVQSRVIFFEDED